MARPSKDVPSIPRAPSRTSAPIQATPRVDPEIPTRLQECELAAVELMDTVAALEDRLTPVLRDEVQGYSVDPEPCLTPLGLRISTTTAMLRAATNRVQKILDALEV